VNVDNRLERMQALIEQKRVEQGLEQSGRSVGRPGSSRFAQAAARVQSARGQAARPVSTHRGQPSRNQNVEVVQIDERQRALPTMQVGTKTVQLGENTATGKEGPSPIGRFMDMYA
jgi:hypothetical protein